MTRLTHVILIAAAAATLAGCGSGGGSNSKEAENRPNGGGGINGISVGNCLIDANFLVQPSQTSIDGSSPAGVNFTLTFYPTAAAAKKAYDAKSPKTTALVENGVVDFRGNPSIYKGAPPAKISKSELAAINTCIKQNKQ
jgi:hypothetical protein